MPRLKSNKPTAVMADEIATEIKRIADSMKALKDSKLNERAVIILLKDLTGLTQSQIKLMLGSLENLDTHFLKAKKKT